MRVERERQEDRVDPALVDDARDLGGRAEDREPAVARRALGRSVVDEADRAQPRLRVLEELVHDRAAEPAGADDEDVPHAHSVAPRLLEVAADRRPSGEDEEDVEGEEEEQHHARIGEAAVEGRQPRQQQGRQARGDEDREAFLDARAVAPHLVEAVEVVDDRPQHGHEREQAVVRRGVRDALGDGDDLGAETQEVGGGEGGERRPDVGDGQQDRDASRGLSDHRRRSPSASANCPAKRSGRNGERRASQSSVIELDRGPPAAPPRPAPWRRRPRTARRSRRPLTMSRTPPARVRDDRGPARDRLDRRDPEVLLAGLQVRRAGPVQPAQLLAAAARAERHGGGGHARGGASPPGRCRRGRGAGAGARPSRPPPRSACRGRAPRRRAGSPRGPPRRPRRSPRPPADGTPSPPARSGGGSARRRPWSWRG